MRASLARHASLLSEPVAVALLAIGAAGCGLRLWMAFHLAPHIDEPASVLAAEMTARHGFPILPSGVPYLQGATLSYLLCPLFWLGWGSPDHLHLLRLLSVALGVATVVVAYLLGRDAADDRGVGILSAAFVALDPVSLQWSGHVRMYAPLELLSVALVWRFTLALRAPSNPALPWGIVAIFWLATYTHIVVAFLLPALALSTVASALRDGWRARAKLFAALGVCGLAPVSLLALNRLLQPDPDAVANGGMLRAFVGGHLLTFQRFVHPSFRSWKLTFVPGTGSRLAPTVIVGCTAVMLLAAIPAVRGNRPPPGIIVVLVAYWTPVLLTAAIVTQAQPRYLISVQPLGLVLTAMVVRRLWPGVGSGVPRGMAPAARGAAAAFALAVALHLGDGARSLLIKSIGDADYPAAARFVALHRKTGEPVLSAMTPALHLALDGDGDLRFLPGPAGRERAKRYTRRVGGGYVDYWLGVPAIVTTAGLCTFIEENPDAWIVVDRLRLGAPWGMKGQMETVIRGMTVEVYRAGGATSVLRIPAKRFWTEQAVAVCGHRFGKVDVSDQPQTAGAR
ncbi:MAG: hypothetical protein ACR2OO_07390 [Thermomicrobiales bacterium]